MRQVRGRDHEHKSQEAHSQMIECVFSFEKLNFSQSCTSECQANADNETISLNFLIVVLQLVDAIVAIISGVSQRRRSTRRPR